MLVSSGARLIGAAQLLGLPSVVDVGRKLQRASLTLGFDRHASTEMAAVVMDVGRQVIAGGEQATVVLRHGRASGTLRVEFALDRATSVLRAAEPALRRGFDTVRGVPPPAPAAAGGGAEREFVIVASRTARAAQSLPSPRAVAAARQQFAERSRDALLLEVRRQNDELEARVATRTAEVEAALRDAEAANESKSVFLSSMSHELRTPLNGVLGYAQLLQHDPSMNAEHRDKLSGIESCAKHLLGLIGELLDFSKIEAGKLELLIGACDVSELLDSVIDIVRSRVRSDAVSLRLENRLRPGTVFRTDEAKLRQVFVNLLGNSAKFTERGEIVLLAEEVGDDRLRFSVRDTGPGMTPEELACLFEPFRQGKAGHTSGGTGLGLTISKSIVECLEGSISATSVPGNGACFMVELPRMAGVADRREGETAHDAAALSLSALHDVLRRLAEGASFHPLAANAVTGLPDAATESLEALAGRSDTASLARFAGVMQALDTASVAA